ERGAQVLKKKKTPNEHEDKGFDERMWDRLDRFLDEHRRVVYNAVFQAFRKVFAEIGHGLTHAVRRRQRVRAGTLEHGNRHRLVTVQIAIGRVVTRPQLHAGNVTQARHTALVAGFDDDVPELL